MANTAVYTIDFGTSPFEFIDATGVSFVRKDESGNVVETATNVTHFEMSSPASRIRYQLDWVGEVQGGDDANIIDFHYTGNGNYAGVGEKTLTCLLCYTGYPSWANIDLPDAEWEVGDDVGAKFGVDLNDFMAMNDDVAGTTFSIFPASVSPNNGQLPEGTTLNSDGTITGVVASAQGGDYSMDFEAVNKYGREVTSQKIGLKVFLVDDAPVFSGVPNYSFQHGELISESLVQYVTSTGAQNGGSGILYQLHSTSDALPLGLALHAFGGVISGTVNPTTQITVYNIVIEVINQAGFSDTDSFTINVAAQTGLVPVGEGWFSGQEVCAISGVAPTWIGGQITFSRNVGDQNPINIDILGNYLASEGSAAVTTVTLANATTLPAGLDALNTNGLGFISGIYSGAAAEIDVQLTADNGEPSADSSIFKFIYTDASVTPVTIDSISAQEGSNDVFVNLSGACETDNLPNQAASYELGFQFQVNPVTPPEYRLHTFIDGAGTNRLRFRLDGVAFSAQNTIVLDYTT